MSTKTKNFEFFKPDLTDPADITELNTNWDRIDAELANAGTRIVSASSDDGVAYTATVPYLTELYTGLEITIIPDISSTVINPTLNVNNLGAMNIRLSLSSNTSAVTTPEQANFFVKDKPVKLMFDAGTANGTWKTVDKQRPSAQDLYGVTKVENGGTGSQNGATGLANLFAAGETVLSAHQYGDKLPDAGIPGRMFFLKVVQYGN